MYLSNFSKVLPNGTLAVSDPDLVQDIQNEVELLVAEGNAREINSKLQGLASLLNDQRETEGKYNFRSKQQSTKNILKYDADIF